jgi:DNA-directed RNA polymerase subunit RPC12/RpoP
VASTFYAQDIIIAAIKVRLAQFKKENMDKGIVFVRELICPKCDHKILNGICPECGFILFKKSKKKGLWKS